MSGSGATVSMGVGMVYAGPFMLPVLLSDATPHSGNSAVILASFHPRVGFLRTSTIHTQRALQADLPLAETFDKQRSPQLSITYAPMGTTPTHEWSAKFIV